MEQDEKPRKIGRNTSKHEIKAIACSVLRDAGLSTGAIAKAIDRNPSRVRQINGKLGRDSLAARHRLKLASKTVDAVMKGFAGEEKDVTVTKVVDGVLQAVTTRKVVVDERVKASDALRAAEMVYSRAEPLKTEAEQAANQTFIQVNQQFIASMDQAAGMASSRAVVLDVRQSEHTDADADHAKEQRE